MMVEEKIEYVKCVDVDGYVWFNECEADMVGYMWDLGLEEDEI